MVTSVSAPSSAAAGPAKGNQGGAAPDWFERGRGTRATQSAVRAVKEADNRPAAAEGTWLQRLWHSFLAVILASYGLSMVLHLVVLIIFSLIIWHTQGGSTHSTELGIAEATGEELLNPQSFEISAGSEGVEDSVPEIEPLPIALPKPLEPTIDSVPVELPGIADGAGEDSKDQAGSGSDRKFELPRGAGVVRRGSFAAWTMPPDPRVGQDYVIVVEINLPAGVKNYDRDDLSGKLIGSDGYMIKIPDGREFNGQGWGRPYRRPRFHVGDDVARIVFFVRGARERLVRDTIRIRSRLLQESQQLEIIF